MHWKNHDFGEVQPAVFSPDGQAEPLSAGLNTFEAVGKTP